jgi:predicted transcriptional regulator
MTVRELAANLGLEILTGEVNLEGKVNYGYTSGLLSDVIANAPEDCVWVTVQRHINILGVAKLKNIAAIVTPRNLKVDKEVIERAKVEGIALLRTAHSAFEISGLLYGILKR